MDDKKAERVVEIFKANGMRIELGAQFSVKGQVAQLLNGCKELLREQGNSPNKKPLHFSCKCGWLHKDVYPGFKCQCGEVFSG